MVKNATKSKTITKTSKTSKTISKTKKPPSINDILRKTKKPPSINDILRKTWKDPKARPLPYDPETMSKEVSTLDEQEV